MIFDFHTHIFPDEIAQNREKFCAIDSTFRELYSNPKSKILGAEELIKSMDLNQISKSVVMGIGWEDSNLAQLSNDYILESVDRFPDRLVGFCSVNPKDQILSSKEIERCALKGMRGIGELHPYSQKFNIADKKIMAPIMDIALTYDLITTTHSSEPIGHLYPGKGNTFPQKLWEFIQNFPDNSIVCAHWGGGLPFYSLMPEVSKSLKNVYFDTAASPLLYSEKIFEICNSLVTYEHILFGSDWPLLNPNKLIKELDNSNLKKSQKTKILFENANTLISPKNLLSKRA